MLFPDLQNKPRHRGYVRNNGSLEAIQDRESRCLALHLDQKLTMPNIGSRNFNGQCVETLHEIHG